MSQDEKAFYSSSQNWHPPLPSSPSLSLSFTFSLSAPLHRLTPPSYHFLSPSFYCSVVFPSFRPACLLVVLFFASFLLLKWLYLFFALLVTPFPPFLMSCYFVLTNRAKRSLSLSLSLSLSVTLSLSVYLTSTPRVDLISTHTHFSLSVSSTYHTQIVTVTLSCYLLPTYLSTSSFAFAIVSFCSTAVNKQAVHVLSLSIYPFLYLSLYHSPTRTSRYPSLSIYFWTILSIIHTFAHLGTHLSHPPSFTQTHIKKFFFSFKRHFSYFEALTSLFLKIWKIWFLNFPLALSLSRSKPDFKSSSNFNFVL